MTEMEKKDKKISGLKGELEKYVIKQLKETMCVPSENTTKSTISSHHDARNLASRNILSNKKDKKLLIPEIVVSSSKASSISSISKLQIEESSAECSKIEFVPPHTDKPSPERDEKIMSNPLSTKHMAKVKYFGFMCRAPKPIDDPSMLCQPSLMNAEKTMRIPLHCITKPEIMRTLNNGCTERAKSTFKADYIL